MGELRLSNNTSTERGWLIPTSGDPDYDEALDRLLSQWIRNVSGLSAGMVRPRWQKEQPPLLPVETNWCAFGVIGWSGDDSPAFTRQTDDGSQLCGMKRLSVCFVLWTGGDGVCVPVS
ncbi:bacteriophage protein [Escherichia coli]|nr:bacteriophage protein [Escherichia coli]